MSTDMPDDVTDAMIEAAQEAMHDFTMGPDFPLTDRDKGITRQAWRVALKAALVAAYSTPEPTSEVDQRKIIADQIRRSCTVPSEAALAGGDRIVYAVADWVENPPEWVTKPGAVTPQSSEATNRVLQWLDECVESGAIDAVVAVEARQLAALPQFTAPVPSIEAIARDEFRVTWDDDLFRNGSSSRIYFTFEAVDRNSTTRAHTGGYIEHRTVTETAWERFEVSPPVPAPNEGEQS